MFGLFWEKNPKNSDHYLFHSRKKRKIGFSNSDIIKKTKILPNSGTISNQEGQIKCSKLTWGSAFTISQILPFGYILKWQLFICAAVHPVLREEGGYTSAVATQSSVDGWPLWAHLTGNRCVSSEDEGPADKHYWRTSAAVTTQGEL